MLLEIYAKHFDPLFGKNNQRDGFRHYLEGLLLPSERELEPNWTDRHRIPGLWVDEDIYYPLEVELYMPEIYYAERKDDPAGSSRFPRCAIVSTKEQDSECVL